jgi:DNA-directed RNA polymerase specialized sigma subunit
LGAPDFQSDPERIAQDKQLYSFYQRFIASLDEGERTIWHKRFELGKTRREIQSASGLTEKQIRILERKLKLRLYKQLEKAGFSLPSSFILILIFAGSIRFWSVK